MIFVARVVEVDVGVEVGVKLYVPKDQMPPCLKDGELVTIDVRRSRWWEILDWLKLKEAYELLPADIKQKIANSGMEHP